MAGAPTTGSENWDATLNAWVGTSIDATNGKIKNEALQVASTAPVADAAVANKKYVDDQIVSASPTAKAWCQVDLNGTLQAGSYNVTSVVRDSAGVYTVTWGTDFADTKYAPQVTPFIANTNTVLFGRAANLATGTCQVVTMGSGLVPVDGAFSIVAFGAQ